LTPDSLSLLVFAILQALRFPPHASRFLNVLSNRSPNREKTALTTNGLVIR